MNTVHNIGPAGDDGDRLKAAGSVFFTLASELWSLHTLLSGTTDEAGAEDVMSRVYAAGAMVAQIGQLADDAAQRLGQTPHSDAWTLTDREQELLDQLGPVKRRPAP